MTVDEEAPPHEGGETVSPLLRPPRSFDEASRMVVDFLATTVPMGVWAITRVVDGTQKILLTSGSAYAGITASAEFPWESSFCRTMSTGETPRTVPDVHRVPALAPGTALAAAGSLDITAYAGTPIVGPDGELFGTVCGFSPEPRPDLPGHEPLLDVLSGLLSAVLESDLALTTSARELERAVTDSETDHLTGLLNRRGWERWLDREEQRYRRFGDPASVIMMDLDLLKQVNDTRGHAAGDAYIRAAAEVLRTSIRHWDALARLGGDEFGMVVDAGPEDARHLVVRLEQALLDAGVSGTFGFAPYSVVHGFPGACAEADDEMYRNKRRRRAARA